MQLLKDPSDAPQSQAACGAGHAPGRARTKSQTATVHLNPEFLTTSPTWRPQQHSISTSSSLDLTDTRKELLDSRASMPLLLAAPQQRPVLIEIRGLWPSSFRTIPPQHAWESWNVSFCPTGSSRRQAVYQVDCQAHTNEPGPKPAVSGHVAKS